MFLIFWIACIYFYVRVIRFSLKEIPKTKEYRKTMSKKEAKKKIKSERTKRDKLDSVLAVVLRKMSQRLKQKQLKLKQPLTKKLKLI